MKLTLGKKWSVQRQEGFTLVNLAGMVVGVGLAMGVAVQGSGIVSNVKNDNFYADLKTMEDRVWSYREMRGYWPGDCDRDGVIGYSPNADLNPERMTELLVEGRQQGSCAVEAREDLNAPFADLRVAGLADDAENNFVMSKHSQGGFFQIGHVASGDKERNAIVAYNVPVDTALWLDEKIDGTTDGAKGRIRRWNEEGVKGQWQKNEQGSVTIAYFFERQI